MAISVIEYQLIRGLQTRGYLPRGGNLLEIGEANWYGDIGLDQLRADIQQFAVAEQRAALLAGADAAVGRENAATWDLARIFWQTFLSPASITAIDLGGNAAAHKLNLNEPIDIGRRFDIVHNAGTLEHVFDIAQAFRNIHNLTMPGGFMIHHAPFVGWVDHGFYSLHPTLFWDIAEANNYRVAALVCAEITPPRFEPLTSREAILELARAGKIGVNASLAAVLQRPAEAAPFRVPMQGYYAGHVSREVLNAWSNLR